MDLLELEYGKNSGPTNDNPVSGSGANQMSRKLKTLKCLKEPKLEVFIFSYMICIQIRLFIFLTRKMHLKTT